MNYSINIITFLLLLVSEYVMMCTENGHNCNNNYECCSGACSAVFGFCLHR
ncbi:conotoxin-like protein [Betaentomopoxvirus amoorei]|uniref:conotoxin-like protein n=1 Tax=Amsacta moorei entomopoxvirus TaxID=28321 RepID=UPI00001622BB|nr:conotoxin-like protein [Amsacta moorei entomopoxvirus]